MKKFSIYLEGVEFSTPFLWAVARLFFELMSLNEGLNDVAFIAISFMMILDASYVASRIVKSIIYFNRFNQNKKREEEEKERILEENLKKNSQNWDSFFKNKGEL